MSDLWFFYHNKIGTTCKRWTWFLFSDEFIKYFLQQFLFQKVHGENFLTIFLNLLLDGLDCTVHTTLRKLFRNRYHPRFFLLQAKNNIYTQKKIIFLSFKSIELLKSTIGESKWAVNLRDERTVSRLGECDEFRNLAYTYTCSPDVCGTLHQVKPPESAIIYGTTLSSLSLSASSRLTCSAASMFRGREHAKMNRVQLKDNLQRSRYVFGVLYIYRSIGMPSSIVCVAKSQRYTLRNFHNTFRNNRERLNQEPTTQMLLVTYLD